MPINFSFLDFIQAQMPNYYDELKIEPFIQVGKSGIKIKKKNRGKFTEYCGGTVTSECIARGKNSSDPAVRKRATFAANARKWKHLKGGILKYQDGNELNPAIDFRNNINSTFAGEYIPIEEIVEDDSWKNKTESIDPDIVRPDFIQDDDEVVENQPRQSSTQSSPTIQRLFQQHSAQPISTQSNNAYTPPAQQNYQPTVSNTGDFNLDASLQHLRSHAHSASTGHCAKYVRQALEAGGMDMRGRPNNANGYIGFLQNKGYQQVSSGSGGSLGGYTPQAGDIIVYKANAKHRYGHIAMYDGQSWYSDFKQKSHKVWKDIDGDYVVLRR